MAGLKLGIDTGGSYTDAVLVQRDTGRIMNKAKSRTTKEDLSIGIGNVVDKLCQGEANSCIDLVCLSTTLATNAIVEGKGAAVGLITIDEPEKYEYPVVKSVNIRGKTDVKGCEIAPLDIPAGLAALNEMKGAIEALAISGYASVRNPEYELKIKELSEEVIGVPVVCAHELTNLLGYKERTITACFNAKLIPLIKELVEATEKVLLDKGIEATLVIIKGDGNCMTESFAEEKPVETLLSGPAASALGGMFLADASDMVIADMGGTTLDIVPVIGRNIPIDKQGATVGGQHTRVRAMHTRSYGLGGDSYMRMNNVGMITFGPERVVPLCVAAAKYTNLTGELRSKHLPSDYHIIERQENDCIALFKRENIYHKDLTYEERKIVDILMDAPHSMLFISEMMNTDIDCLNIARLLRSEIIYLISVTPTDLLHASGEFNQYDDDISRIALGKLATRRGVSEEMFGIEAENIFTGQVCKAIIETLLIEKGVGEEEMPGRLLDFLLADDKGKSNLMDFNLIFNAPMVGIGAPAGAWLRRAGERLGCDVVIPENSEVANAIGTVSGNMLEVLEGLIRFDPQTKKYIAHLPDRRDTFENIETAVSFCEHELMLCGRDLATRMGVKKYSTHITKENPDSPDCGEKGNSYADVKIKLTVQANAEHLCY